MGIKLTINSLLDLIHFTDVHDGVKDPVKLIFESLVR
jgi:hypothetical protein